MYTGPITSELLRGSVIAVPPLCLSQDLTPNNHGMSQIAQNLHNGGVSTILYGGNANMANYPISMFGHLLEAFIETVADEQSWIIPSVGPDYGKCEDQLAICRALGFPAAMILPMREMCTPDGFATGVRRLAEKHGIPFCLYLKFENYIDPKEMAALVKDGCVVAVKYAVEREDYHNDLYLREISETLDADILVSGIGEMPTPIHFAEANIASFSSGGVCIAPKLSTKLLRALQSRDKETVQVLLTNYEDLESVRFMNSPAGILHEAIEDIGIAETGPMMPFNSRGSDTRLREMGKAAASKLLQAEILQSK